MLVTYVQMYYSDPDFGSIKPWFKRQEYYYNVRSLMFEAHDFHVQAHMGTSHTPTIIVKFYNNIKP